MAKKLEYAYVKECVEGHKGHKLLSDEYEGIYVPLKILCFKGHIFHRTIDIFRKHPECPYCSGYYISYEKANDFITSQGYKMLNSECFRSREYLLLECPEKHKIKMTYDSFRSGSRCSECYGNKKKDTTTYKKEVFDLVSNEYTVIGEYTNNSTKIKTRHNKCGFVWDISPNSFLRGTRCPDCMNKRNGNKRRITNDEFKNRLYKMYKDEYIPMEDYKGITHKILIRHNVDYCNNEWETTPNRLLNSKKGCPACVGRRISEVKSKPHSVFLEEVDTLVGDEYIVITEYINNHTPIEIKHANCDNTFKIQPQIFLNGGRCPHCNESYSNGEKRVIECLNKHELCYEPQYSFEDCRNVHPLLFDFAIFHENTLVYLIEYDGQQHFEPVDFAGRGEKWANERLDYTQKSDNIKNQYCKDNNIPLLRIPYWEYDNIDKIILNNIAKKYKQNSGVEK